MTGLANLRVRLASVRRRIAHERGGNAVWWSDEYERLCKREARLMTRIVWAERRKK